MHKVSSYSILLLYALLENETLWPHIHSRPELHCTCIKDGCHNNRFCCFTQMTGSILAEGWYMYSSYVHVYVYVGAYCSLIL